MAEDSPLTYPIDDNDGVWELGDGVPGPAGAASLALGDELTLTVDVAEPSLLLGLVAPNAGVLPPRLALLVPDARANERTITIADTTLLHRLGRLAVLEDTARERALWGDPTGWWDAEAVLLRAQAPAGLDLANGLDDRARRGAAALLGLDTEALVGLETSIGDRVRAVAGALAATLEPLDAAVADRLRTVSRRVTRSGPTLSNDTVEAAFGHLIDQAFTVALEPGLVETAALATRGAPGVAPERQVGLDPDQLPPGLATAGPLRLAVGSDNRSAVARLDVPPALGTPQLWLVVSRRSDGTLLALVPMHPAAGGNAVEATITLRAPEDLDTVHIDATVDPTPAPASSARRALRAATARGRVAARASRLGHHDEAALLWLACSQRWGDAGDRDREAVARTWAVLALEEADLRSDADQLRRDAPRAREGWAQDRARRLPATGAPFLGELMPSPEGDARS